jgi:hypothetical protein
MELRRISQVPVYPFLVAALPVIHFHEANFRQLEIGDGIRMILLYWVVTGFFLFLGRLLWRDVHRAAMIVAPLATVLFLGNKIGGILSLVFLGLALALGILFLFRPGDMRRASVPLNLALLVLVAMPIVQTVRVSRAQVAPVPTALFDKPLELQSPDSGSQPPDIYFLLMDGLGQPDYLEKNFQLNRKLLDGVLEQRGFKVLRHSQSNYTQTALSLSATMNIGFLHELVYIPDPKNSDRRILAGLVAENRVVRALRTIGYDLVTYPSGYPLTRMKDPDRRHQPLINPTFLEYFVIEDGILPLLQPLLGRGPADFSFAMRRNRLEYMFDHLADARAGIPDNRPVFVFAHIMAPHPPFVFSRTGEALRSRNTFSFADGSHWYDIHGRDSTPYYIMYCEQLTYVMKRLGEAVDAILASSPRPPVIIIMGDHGPGSKLHHERIMYTDLEERFGIFNAWYIPPGVEVDLGEAGTALNTFPTLFNALFDAGYPKKSDRYFYARMSLPYSYVELDKLKE